MPLTAEEAKRQKEVAEKEAKRKKELAKKRKAKEAVYCPFVFFSIGKVSVVFQNLYYERRYQYDKPR